MKKLKLILSYIFLLIGIFLFSSCKKNLTSPLLPINNPSSLTGLFHGTWLNTNEDWNPLRLSFDSVSVMFLEQVTYDFGIHREFAGNYSVDSSKVILDFDYGSRSRYWYHFEDDTLLLRDSLFHFNSKYLRIGTSPSSEGWSVKPPIISEQTYSIFGSIRAYCFYSDSLSVIITYNNDKWYLIKLNTVDGTSTSELTNGIRAVDASGSFLWFATDSTIEKRTLSDTTSLTSFSYRSVVGSDYFATGIAVGTNYGYLMTVCQSNNPGILLKFNLSGEFLRSTQTSTVIKDLCLVNDRLFCVIGDETFLELDPSTGYVITNLNLPDRPFGNNIDGITFAGSTIQLAGNASFGELRISEIAVPAY